ncbi:hypothetical protein [Thiohalocapsa halophila]|uniref:hypothetical protein n=1 Tax=Thiohalocapsa halophila TaxID=69359 RepID=UPI00190740F6|nr:hypothetical protein [Thiohalocapsa halophila]
MVFFVKLMDMASAGAAGLRQAVAAMLGLLGGRRTLAAVCPVAVRWIKNRGGDGGLVR